MAQVSVTEADLGVQPPVCPGLRGTFQRLGRGDLADLAQLGGGQLRGELAQDGKVCERISRSHGFASRRSTD
jgi:hypothetical protein